MPDTVAPVITDAITQANVATVAEAPTQAIASLYQVASAATGLSMQNAVSNQANQYTIANTTTTASVDRILTERRG